MIQTHVAVVPVSAPINNHPEEVDPEKKGVLLMRNSLDLWRSRSPWAFIEDMDKIFSQFVQPTTENRSMWNFNPAVDVDENDDHFLISVDLPGIKKDDVKIEVAENTLTISGERRHEKKEKDDRRSEKFYGRFERSFALPRNVDASKIEARYENGVLELAVPKAEEAKPRTIQIQAGGGKEGFFGKFLGRGEQGQVKDANKSSPHLAS
jgi:HSP20 family protein